MSKLINLTDIFISYLYAANVQEPMPIHEKNIMSNNLQQNTPRYYYFLKQANFFDTYYASLNLHINKFNKLTSSNIYELSRIGYGQVWFMNFFIKKSFKNFKSLYRLFIKDVSIIIESLKLKKRNYFAKTPGISNISFKYLFFKSFNFSAPYLSKKKRIMLNYLRPKLSLMTNFFDKNLNNFFYEQKPSIFSNLSNFFYDFMFKYKNHFYNLYIKKSNNNYFITVTNLVGEVFLTMSAGQIRAFRLKKKRRVFTNIYYMINKICKKLSKKQLHSLKIRTLFLNLPIFNIISKIKKLFYKNFFKISRVISTLPYRHNNLFYKKLRKNRKV